MRRQGVCLEPGLEHSPPLTTDEPFPGPEEHPTAHHALAGLAPGGLGSWQPSHRRARLGVARPTGLVTAARAGDQEVRYQDS